FFFFSSRRRHTRSKRDWSSDVCSSDLTMTFEPRPASIELICDDPRLPVDDNNLVVRAAKLLGVPGARITLQKRTPLAAGLGGGRDRKSTRLNSSHVSISYAVFCLKKKK